MNRPYSNLTVKEVREEIPGFKNIIFAENDISYKAGQYLTLIHYANNEEIRRSYSITSAPLLNEPLAIGVRRIENGFFSRYLVDTVVPGMLIDTIGAGGFFTLPENASSYQQVFLFAAGSGITPMLSLIKTLLFALKGKKVSLIYSSSSPGKTLFLKEINILRQAHREYFTVHHIYSNNADLRQAHLHREFMMELVRNYAAFELAEILFYICGPEDYMRMCTYTLRELHVPEPNIKRENFVIQRLAVPKSLPPVTGPHRITVRQGGHTYEYTVSFPNTILQAAKNQGIGLPYSCETGRCGSCVAKCVSGKVWLSYNEVLTDNELQKGLVLTCVGHPIEGPVILEI